ncbi:MAG: sulfotransferase family 2 domain-containing protein [Pseudomonadota bacterium]
MIISPQRRYVFVHIPKTGGTSMALALEGRAAKNDILIGDTPKARRRRGRLRHLQTPGRLWKHSTIRDIGALINPADFFVFTLVRNPWDRMVSYYHWLREQRFDHPAVTSAQTYDFKDFLSHPQTQMSLQQNSYRSYVVDEAGVDHCCLYARLEYPDDLEPLWDHLAFRVSVSHENRSDRHKDWRIYYDTETADIVQEKAGEDIARFGYTFDP